jgi:hypothetical protein
VATRSR